MSEVPPPGGCGRVPVPCSKSGGDRRRMRNRLVRALATCTVVAVIVVGATGAVGACAATAPTSERAITVGSFDFAESRLLAEIYSQALEAPVSPCSGPSVSGPRELVGPALLEGLVEFVPEYAGTALQFLSLGARAAGGRRRGDPCRARARAGGHASPRRSSRRRPQDANAFVVAARRAERLGLDTLSDLGGVARQLTFGGPPECATRPLCLVGLQRGLRPRVRGGRRRSTPAGRSRTRRSTPASSTSRCCSAPIPRSPPDDLVELRRPRAATGRERHADRPPGRARPVRGAAGRRRSTRCRRD